MLHVVARHLDRTQRPTFMASAVPQLIRSVREELNAVFDDLSIRGMIYDREALAKTVQERLVLFMHKPIHLLSEWLNPITYANALKQRQCERNLADLCLQEILTENAGLRGELSVNEVLSEFAKHKDGAWREDSHTLMSESKKY